MIHIGMILCYLFRPRLTRHHNIFISCRDVGPVIVAVVVVSLIPRNYKPCFHKNLQKCYGFRYGPFYMHEL